MMTSKRIIVLCISAAILLFIGCNKGGAKVGLPAPPLALDRVGGGRIDLAELKGKVVLVNFWATWCDPCKEEIPEFNELYRKMEGKPFELLAVSVDAGDKKVEEMAQKLNMSFPVLRDPKGATALSWGSTMYPETYLIGPDGVIVDKFLGVKDWTGEAMIEMLENLMPESK